MLVPTCDPKTQKPEQKEWYKVGGQPGLHNKTPSIKKKIRKEGREGGKKEFPDIMTERLKGQDYLHY